MKLSECKMGTIVTNCNALHGEKYRSTSFKDWKLYQPFTRIGYISGLTINSVNETIPLVKWSDELVMDNEVHHSNLSVYED